MVQVLNNPQSAIESLAEPYKLDIKYRRGTDDAVTHLPDVCRRFGGPLELIIDL